MGQIITKESYQLLKEKLKQEKKKVVLCHGVFDLIHPGHILHFEEAKSLGDVLVVSVTAAAYVRKGPGRPYFDDTMRLKFLSAIACIDYVMLSESSTVEDIIEAVEPDLYVKGSEYAKEEDDITGKIGEEIELVRSHGGEIYYTSGQVFSSTKLINMALPAMTDEVKQYMLNFKKSYDLGDVQALMEKMKAQKVLVVGDIIMDEYIFCHVQGLMSKDMGYSSRYIKSEQYLGGVLAVARHIASFSDHVTVASIAGKEENIHSRFLNELSDKMRVILECSEEYETIIKKRYIQQNEKRDEFHKIFSVNNLSQDMVIPEKVMLNFERKLKAVVAEYDLVIVCDFGHGLVSEEVMNILQENAKFLAVNCQTNSSNYGLNIITKYRRADVFALDQKELRLAFPGYVFSDEAALIKLEKHFESSGWLTRGSAGATSINEQAQTNSCPAFTLKVKDTIGAGDAFYALASLSVAVGGSYKMGAFLGNIMGALASNIVGNKESIDKVDVLKYASTLLNL